MPLSLWSPWVLHPGMELPFGSPLPRPRLRECEPVEPTQLHCSCLDSPSLGGDSWIVRAMSHHGIFLQRETIQELFKRCSIDKQIPLTHPYAGDKPVLLQHNLEACWLHGKEMLQILFTRSRERTTLCKHPMPAKPAWRVDSEEQLWGVGGGGIIMTVSEQVCMEVRCPAILTNALTCFR